MRHIPRLFLLNGFIAIALESQVSVLMSRYDSCTTAANTRETILTPANVNPSSFGRVFSCCVDGAVYVLQPLYVPSVGIPGMKSAHNVVYIATMNDKVYAFDADHSGPPLWIRDLTDELRGHYAACPSPTSPIATI